MARKPTGGKPFDALMRKLIQVPKKALETGGYLTEPWEMFLYLLIAAPSAVFGYRICRRRRYGRRWSRKRGYYMPRTWWYE